MAFTILCLATCFLAFSFLARLAPCNPEQPRFDAAELRDDALYWALSVILYGGVSTWLLHMGLSAALGAGAPHAERTILAGYGWAAALPLAAQCLIVLVLTDIAQYWLHRFFHGHAFWPLHAIHHSPVNVDWTTTFRVHPVQFLVYSAGVAALIRTLGFSPMTYVVLAPFNLFMGAYVHANLNWTHGPLKYVVASPVFHRWHHSSDPAVRDKNFAPTFPVLDLMFGTFHMPEGELPAGYGAEGVPNNILGQMAYPFHAIAARFRPDPGVGAPAA
ncbi:MAG TPA: sterol desaturase family protein [Caulobacteraceae bacterium]|nr:sterol desaturase family protein [Caulobacteraceae bacterium]